MVVQGNEPVNAGYFAEVEDLFFDALELPPDQRETWLQEKCQDRQEIYTEVQTLLEAHDSSESFMSESPDLKGIAACPDLSGRRLGSYLIDKEIAKGGMGRVYSADRVDGEYQQRVAVKVVELGNVEAEMFRRERQTLANLEHPNIVTLLDGGTLEEGFPYLVMELVDGQAIDTYNIEHGLSKKALITLFCTLCEVVDRAHQQGVIHCDLKPANILVTEQGVLKLLDFGISQTLIKTQDSQKQELNSQALTPEYASPQRQDHLPPHVTDDVYSLGIVLGQLLIGESLPRVATELLVKKRYKKIDIEQMLQLIPSHELRMVIKKATHDDPEHRYQSAQLFATDLQNFLQEKPVEAMSGRRSWQFYTAYKNLTRNRIFWAVLIVSLLSLGTGAYFWNQHKVAELNAEAAEAAQKVITDMDAVFFRTKPSIDVQAEFLGIAIQNIGSSLVNAPENIPAIHARTDSLIRLGELEGHPLYVNRGERGDAKGYFIAAIEELERLSALVAEDSEDLSVEGKDEINSEVVLLDLLRAKRLLAEVLLYSGESVSAAQQLRELEQHFNEVSFTLSSNKQTLNYMHDLLSWASFNLFNDDYDQVEHYLQRFEKYEDRVTTVDLEGRGIGLKRNRDGSGLSEKQKKQKRAEVLNLKRESIEVLNMARYLKVFAAAQRGHIAYQQGEYQEASRYYSLARDTTELDLRLTPLLTRIYTMRACIALKTAQPELARQFREETSGLYNDLINDHPNARRYTFKASRLENKQLSLVQQLDCDAPKNTIFPLRNLPPLVDEE